MCCSCEKYGVTGSSHRLMFRTSVTKASAITTGSFNAAGNTFVLNAYLEKDGRGEGTFTEGDKTDPNYIKNSTFTYSGGTWSCDGCNWRNLVYTNFWCYSPKDMTYGERPVTLPAVTGSTEDSVQKSMSFTYTMPSATADSTDAVMLEDMIFAYARRRFNADDNTDEGVVTLQFGHPLSAIKFKVGTIRSGYGIKSITIKGFNTYGACTLTGSTSTVTSKDTVSFAWSGQNKATSSGYTQKVTLAELQAGDMTTGSKIFMVVPQALTDNAKVTVVFTSGGDEISKTASLGGSSVTWAAGKSYTYKLTLESSELTASLTDFNGGSWYSHDSEGTAAGQLTGENW